MNEKTPLLSGSKSSSELYFDVIIVGSGISGINAAYRLQTEGPSGLSYVILESREAMGGTWDLFKYPGLRSDSDIYTFGFAWSQWDHQRSLATGQEIRNYLKKSTRSAGIDQNICYRHSVETADWNSSQRNWNLSVKVEGEEKPVPFRSQFLLLGTGYYDYETPLQTVIPGIDRFQGKIIHPQFWPKEYDYTNKEVVIIGSGATAITILPSIADKVKKVTMLQRSPGYVFSLPSTKWFTTLLFMLLPGAMAQFISRLLFITGSHISYLFCKKCPGLAKLYIKTLTKKQLPPDIKWDPNFKPRYNPWEQRFCASMDGDFYAALRSGKGDVVTDTIATVTEDSIELKSGQVLRPDVIVTATGLKLKFGGGIQFSTDGEKYLFSDRFAWKSAMLQDTPNMFFLTGYETASWTLGADVSVQLFIRLLNIMKQKNAKVIIPRLPTPDMPESKLMQLSSTYVTKAGPVLPKGGTGQWAAKSNYLADSASARWGDVTTDLEFL